MKLTLKQARHFRYLTQDEIAKKIGVHKHSYRKWEIGETKPTSDNLIKLLEVLQIELKDLIL